MSGSPDIHSAMKILKLMTILLALLLSFLHDKRVV